MKKILKYVFFGLVVAGFCTGMVFLSRDVREGRASLLCREMEVTFLDSLGFVSKEDVRSYLQKEYGAYIGQVLDSVRLGRIEEIIESESAVSDCEAWVTDDGLLHISIKQRKPAVRFLNGDKGFYVDDGGYVFPLHPDYTADVPTVEGAAPVAVEEGFRGVIPPGKGREWIERIIRLTAYMQDTGEWKKTYDRIAVSEEGDVVLLPVRGDERFIFGQPDLIEDKFSRIHKYYSHIKAAKGGIYGTVNVKYKGQIICRAKDMSQPLTSEPEN